MVGKEVQMSKSTEIDYLNEIMNDIQELNNELISEVEEMQKKNKINVAESANLIELYNQFDISGDALLNEAARKKDVQFSLDNVKYQKKLLVSVLK